MKKVISELNEILNTEDFGFLSFKKVQNYIETFRIQELVLNSQLGWFLNGEDFGPMKYLYVKIVNWNTDEIEIICNYNNTSQGLNDKHNVKNNLLSVKINVTGYSQPKKLNLIKMFLTEIKNLWEPFQKVNAEHLQKIINLENEIEIIHSDNTFTDWVLKEFLINKTDLGKLISKHIYEDIHQNKVIGFKHLDKITFSVKGNLPQYWYLGLNGTYELKVLYDLYKKIV